MTGNSPADTDVIVITGASRGIGAAIAHRLASAANNDTARNTDNDTANNSVGGPSRRRLHLIINYATNMPAASQVVDAINTGGPAARATAVQADVSRPDEVAALFAAADEAGTLTGLVNNAAILYPIGRFLDIDPARLERVWAVNITGSFFCAQQAVRRMSTSEGGNGGSIVNVSSRAASFGSPNEFIDYAASKGALDSLTKGLATEVAAQGIRVNAVRPGLIETDIHAAAGRPDRVEALAPNVPLGRGGRPDEVANLVTWLLSDQASYVTGALVDIGGGR